MGRRPAKEAVRKSKGLERVLSPSRQPLKDLAGGSRRPLEGCKAAHIRDLRLDVGTGRRYRICKVGGPDRLAEIAIVVEAASWTDRPPAWNAVDPAGLRARAEH